MKRVKLGLAALAISTAGFFAFTTLQGGGIKGSITPADGAKEAWALSSTDTIRATITSGAFTFTNAKAGTYKVMIDATEPYKDVIKEGVQVADGQTTDLGEIKLEK